MPAGDLVTDSLLLFSGLWSIERANRSAGATASGVNASSRTRQATGPGKPVEPQASKRSWPSRQGAAGLARLAGRRSEARRARLGHDSAQHPGIQRSSASGLEELEPVKGTERPHGAKLNTRAFAVAAEACGHRSVDTSRNPGSTSPARRVSPPRAKPTDPAMYAPLTVRFLGRPARPAVCRPGSTQPAFASSRPWCCSCSKSRRPGRGKIRDRPAGTLAPVEPLPGSERDVGNVDLT